MQAWLERRNLLAPSLNWVLGLSGGPDSTILLHALLALSERAELHWNLFPAHLHHGLRADEADADAAFASDLADELNLPFHSEQVDIRAEVESRGGSLEETARHRRYEFLERVALKTGSELVALAHHADDNAETILHRICRGTGLRGLAGIHDVRPIQPESHIRVVRPLLRQRRSTIEELCAAQGLEIRTDSTNRSLEFTRGRIRNKVMPLLAETLNPQVTDALLRLAEHARWLGTYLEDAAARTFDALVISEHPHYIVLNVRGLLGKQRIIQAEVIRRALALVNPGEQDLAFTHIDAILRLAEDPASGKEVHLPGPVVVRKQYDRLEFGPLTDEGPPPELSSVFVACPGRTPLAMLGLELRAEIRNVGPLKIKGLQRNANRYEEWLDYEQVRPPLLVRGRREGERFHPLGAPGAKTLGDFLSDEKVDPQVRARTGILCDQRGPIWVMPLRIDERVKLRPRTRKALRLVLTPLVAQPRGSA
ncbi:MAG: tRNA lysidine(34) synthetase TilS [Phycisphaerae bacterium]|nr:tRNA lysidine(34) synthetase TilS [Phycisphaerae bacterium]